MKTILFLGSLGYGRDNGVNTYSHQIVDYFRLNKFPNLQFYSVNLNYDSTTEFNIEEDGNLISVNIPVPMIKKANEDAEVDAQKSGKFIWLLLKNKLKASNEIVLHINWINHGSLAHYLKEKLKCKVVLTRHCIPWKSLISESYKDFYQLTLGNENALKHSSFALELGQYKSIDKFIAVTRCSKHDLQSKFKVASEKIHVISNGIKQMPTTRKFDSEKSVFKSEFNYDVNDKILIYIGRNEKNIGLSWLMYAFNQVVKCSSESIKLIIVGNMDLSELIKSNQETLSRITIMGFLEKEVLLKIYKIADLGIIPSAYEQCSYAAIEMMQNKLLVLSSDVDGLGEMVKDKVNGLSFHVEFTETGPKPDIEGFKQNIIFGLKAENRQKLDKMRTAAFLDSQRLYNIENTLNQVRKVYEEV